MSDTRPVLFTIGHSNHELAHFLALLKRNRVTAIADVRSSPSSRLEHFRGKALAESLKNAGLAYVFLGNELGARRSEAECYVNGRADYHRIERQSSFQTGVERIRKGVNTHRICLLCAEKEPLDCHRAILICRNLRHDLMQIQHILADGSVEDHSISEKRLVGLTRTCRTLFEPDLSDDELIERAYDERALEIAFQSDSEGSEA